MATIEDIRERADVVEIVSHYVRLQKAGKGYKGLCPFHDEKTPSFTVSAEKQLWYCFGACQEGGDVFDFIQKIENLSFPEAVEHLAQRVGLTWTRSGEDRHQASARERLYDLNRRAADLFRRALRHEKAGRVAREYLAQRGVTADLIERFGLGYAPNAWDKLAGALERQGIPLAEAVQAGLVRPRGDGSGYYDYFRHRLMFPIQDLQGRIIAFGGRALDESPPKYLNSPENPAFSKGRTLYALNWAARSIRAKDAVVVMEGYMDVIAAHQFGVENAVATLGTALTPWHVRILGRYTRHIYVAYDADSAGMAAMLRSSDLFDQAGLEARLVLLPRGWDPDEFLHARGAEAFQEQLAAALELVDYQLKMVLDRHDPGHRAQRTAAIQQTLPILAAIGNPIRQAEYIKQVATWGYQPDQQRIARAEEAIHLELRRQQQLLRRPLPAARAVSPETPALEVPLALEKLVKSEQWLLTAMVQEPAVIPQVRTELGPDDFSQPIHREVVQALYRQYDREGRVEPHVLLRAVSDKARNLLSALLMKKDQTREFTEVTVLIKGMRVYAAQARLAEVRRRLENLPGDLDEEGQKLLQESMALQQRLRQYEEDPDFPHP